MGKLYPFAVYLSIFCERVFLFMEKFIVPEIAPLFYNGQKVLTINQMSVLFKCEGANIRVAFSRHRKNFVENEDYFYLNYEQLAKFKAANRQFTSVKYNRYAPFSNLASSLYLWAKSGVEKLAKIVCYAINFRNFV